MAKVPLAPLGSPLAAAAAQANRAQLLQREGDLGHR